MADNNIGTPHINAKPEDFAKTVLLPGDPLRSKRIAESYLDDAVLINNVRGVQGYTGKYKGVPVTVMASGMGMPSMGIYSYELYNMFDVDNIIRIGSAGALSRDVKIRDIVFGMGACTNSAYASQFQLTGTFAPIASYPLLDLAIKQAREVSAYFHVGNILSSDPFYNADESSNGKWADLGVLCVEMEAAALYMNAAYNDVNALSIISISDNFVTGAKSSVEDRTKAFTDMMKLALETAVK